MTCVLIRVGVDFVFQNKNKTWIFSVKVYKDFHCHTWLHLGFSSKLRIWQVSAWNMKLSLLPTLDVHKLCAVSLPHLPVYVFWCSDPPLYLCVCFCVLSSLPVYIFLYSAPPPIKVHFWGALQILIGICCFSFKSYM